MNVCCCFRHFAGNFSGQNADVYQSTYEQELRDYGYSQRERREQTSPVGSDYRAESTTSFSRSTSARQRSPSYERHDSYDERYYGDCYRDTDSQADDRESVWSQRSGGGSTGRKRDSHEKQYDDRYVMHKHFEDGSSKDASAVHGFSPLGSEHSQRSRDVKYRSSHSKSPVSGRKDKDRGSRRGTTPPTPTDDDFPLGGKGSSHAGGGGVDPKEVKHKLLKITKHDKDAGMDVQMQDVCNNVDVVSKSAKATPSVYRSSGDVRSQVGKPRKRALDETDSLAKKPCVRDRAAISLKVEEYISRQKKAFEKKKLDQIARSDKTNDVGDELTPVKIGDDSVAATDAKHLPAARVDGTDRTATCNASSPSSKTSSEPDVECESVAGSDVLNLEKEKRQLLKMLEQLDETGSVSDEQGASVAALEVSRHLKKPKLDGVAGIERDPSSLVMKLQRDIAKFPTSTDGIETTSQLVTDMIAVSNSGDLEKHTDYSKFEPIDTTRSFRKQMEARRRVEQQDGTAVRVTDGGKREQKRTACKFNPPPPLKHIECCDDEQVPATDEYTSLAEVPAEFKSKKRRKSAAVPEVDTFTKLKRSYRTRNANAMLSSGDEGDEQSEKAELAAKQEKVLEDIVTLLTEQKQRDQPGKGELKSPHSSRRESKNPPRIIPDSVVIGGGGDGKAESNGPQEPRKMPRGRRRGSPMSLPLPRFAFETCWSPRQSPKHSVKPSELTGSPKERSPMGSKINSPSFSPGCQHSPTVALQKTVPSMPQPPSPALTPPPPPPPPPSRGTTDTPLKPQLSSTEGTALVSITRPLVVDTGQPLAQGPATQQLDVASPSPAATVAAPPPPPPLHTASTQQAETVVCQPPVVSPSMADVRTETDETMEMKPSTPDEPLTQLVSESESTQDSVPAVSQENASAELQQDTTSAPVTDNDTKTVNHKDHVSVDKPEEATPSNVLSPKLDSSDTDLSELGSPNQPSLEEQIRALDEKLSLTAAAVHAVKMPDTSALSLSDYRERFRVKRRTDAPLPPTTAVAMPPKPEPSDIAKSLLARNSIFDQDSKRLKQINEKYEMRGVRGMSVDEPVRTSRDVTGLEYEALTTPVFGAIGRQSSAPGLTMQQVMPVSIARAMAQPKSAPPASSVGEKGFSYNGRTLGSPRVVAANSIAVESPYLQNATSIVHSSQQNTGPLTAFGAGVSAATAAKLKLSPASDSQDGKLVINLSPVSQTGSCVTTCVLQKPAQSPVRPSEPARLKPILCQTSGQCVTSNSVTSNSQRWTDNPQKPLTVAPTTNPVAPCVNADVSKPKDPLASPSVSTSQKKPVRDFGESSHSKKDAPSVPKQKSADEHTNVDKTKARTKEVWDTPTKTAQKSAKAEPALTKNEAKNESTSSAKTSGEPANKKPKLQSDKKDKKHGSVSKSDENPSSASSSSKKCVSTTSAVSKPGSAVKCNKVVAKDNTKRTDEKDRNREHGKHTDKSKPHSSGLVKDKQQKSRDDGHDVVRQDSSGKDKRHSKPKERIEKEKDVAKSDRSETQKSTSVAERTECKDAVKSVDSGDVTKVDRTDHVKCESLPSDKPEQEDRTGPETEGAASARDQHKGEKQVKLEKRDSKSKDRGSDGKHSKTSDGKPSKDRTKEQHSGHDGKPKSKLNNKVVDKQKNRSGKIVDSAKDSRCSKGEKEKCGKERSDREKDRKGDRGQQRDREHSGNPKKGTESQSASKEKSDRSHHKVDDEKQTHYKQSPREDSRRRRRRRKLRKSRASRRAARRQTTGRTKQTRAAGVRNRPNNLCRAATAVQRTVPGRVLVRVDPIPAPAVLAPVVLTDGANTTTGDRRPLRRTDQVNRSRETTETRSQSCHETRSRTRSRHRHQRRRRNTRRSPRRG